MKNLKDYSFDFNTAGLSDYLQANADMLIQKIVLDTTEAQYYKVMPNIKFGELIPVAETGDIDSIAFNGTGCNTFTGGTITLTEVELRTCPWTIEKSWCPADLDRTIMSVRLAPGSYNENVGAGFEEAITNDITKKANVFMSRQFWNGTASGSGCSGILEQLQSASLSGSVVNVPYTSLTISNSVDVVNSYVLSLPDNLKTTTTILSLNHSDFQAYQLGLVASNLYHFDPITLANGAMAIQVPFTNTIAISTEIAAGYATLTNPENFFYGTDLMSDITSPVAWWSNDFQQHRMKLSVKLGSAVGIASQVVLAS